MNPIDIARDEWPDLRWRIESHDGVSYIIGEDERGDLVCFNFNQIEKMCRDNENPDLWYWSQPEPTGNPDAARLALRKMLRGLV